MMVDRGNEFGTNTGRRRRAGWFDAVMLRHAVMRVAAQQFLGKASVDEAKVKEYYGAHPDEFRTPERVRAEYVMISADALAAQETVTPKEARDYVDFLSTQAGVPVSLVGVGPGREQFVRFAA